MYIILNNMDTITIPSLIDIHVHVREPGHEHKEDYDSLMKAAYQSGITTICAMPNTNPALTDIESYHLINNIAKKASEKHKVDYFLYQAATDPPSPILNFPNICGIKMYLNCTTGNLKISNIDSIEYYFKSEETKNKPIMCHAEIDILPTVLEFSHKYKQYTHICHVARKSEMELIKQAKKINPYLTCEVSPHHLLLTKRDDKLYNVKPELQTIEDINYLWDNLDLIDCIATDHAPHLYSEKVNNICYGFTGVETLLPLMLYQVKIGRLTMDRLIELTHTNPIKILKLSPDYAKNSHIVIKNPLTAKESKYKENTYSKSKWSPFVDHYVIENPVVL